MLQQSDKKTAEATNFHENPISNNMQWIISSDLLRPFSRILHHSLPKAVIHVRRHCFGRSRLEDVEFLILKITSIQGQDIYKTSPPIVLLYSRRLCSDASG